MSKDKTNRLLVPEKSLCEKRQKIIISRDKHSKVEHRAYNLERKYDVRHYRLDGDLIKQEKCCDFLLLNDTLKNAYFIELKGANIDEAVPQLQNAVSLCREELKGYECLLRIVCSKVRTHMVESNTFRKFKARWGSKLKCQADVLEETL